MKLQRTHHLSRDFTFSAKFPSRATAAAAGGGTTINLSILESSLRRCRIAAHFLQIHAQMTASGFIHDTFAASRLVSFAAAAPFLHLEHSRRLLLQIESPNTFTWNTVMRACTLRNSPESCLPLYKLMLRRSDCYSSSPPSPPDNYTHPVLIHASAARMVEFEGKQIHAHASKFGFDSDVYVLNTLINMYSVCGSLADARLLFDESPVLDSVSWNSILAAYVQAGNVDEAVGVFSKMPEPNTIAANSMIALFSKWNRVEDAKEVFEGMDTRDVVTWTAMISCYEQNELFVEAVQMFSSMHKESFVPDEVAMVSALSACAQLEAMKEGEMIHGLTIRYGHEYYVNLQNALMNMYSNCGNIFASRLLFDLGSLDQISWNSIISGHLKCGLVEEAKAFFVAMPQKDLVSWSTMISGYVQHDHFSQALELFNVMQVEAVRPDETILVSIISACSCLTALEQGKWLHAYIKKNDYEINKFLGTTLIDMYMKCGCVDAALEIFDEMNDRGTSTWNAVILGLAMNGLVEESLEKFLAMERFGIVPNDITFVGVLGACRHVGLVDKGRQYFRSMQQAYNIEPNNKHYGCMVDLLARAGLLCEAEELVETMPMTPDVATWGALLGACKKHGATQIGERLGKKLIELDPKHDGFHVLLSNLYASKGRWQEVMELRGTMKQRGLIKVPGCSMIEFNGVVHEFLAGERSHSQTKEIDEMLDEIARRLKMEGYQPDTSNVAYDVEDEEKETALFRHSERLAIAFGLINIHHSVPIRIMKNLRICTDCHAAAKIISKAFQREIIIRDRHLFHHFNQGSCSCTDYW